MPRYFFDIIDGGSMRDDEGIECATEQDMLKAAKRALPEIAKEELGDNGDRRFFTLVVRDEQEHAVYTSTLAYSGLWLRDRP